MSLESRLMVKRSGQQGIGLPAAIFIITVMAFIAAAVTQLVSQNAQTYSEAVSLSRAFYAAESGAGFGMNTIFPPEDYNTAYASTPSRCPGSGSPTVYNFVSSGLNQCKATVTCTLIAGTTHATIESTGECDDVVRTVQVRTVY